MTIKQLSAIRTALSQQGRQWGLVTPQSAEAWPEFTGRVAVEHVQDASPKSAARLGSAADVTKARLSALERACMIRLGFSKWTRLAALLTVTVTALNWRPPAAAQAGPPNPSSTDGNMVDEFMASLPPSDQFTVDRTKVSYSRSNQVLLQLMAQEAFYRDRNAVSAVRFYNGKKHGGKRMDRFTRDVRDAFAVECKAKGGSLATENGDIHYRTIYGSRTSRGLQAKVRPTSLDICMQTPRESLGALIVTDRLCRPKF